MGSESGGRRKKIRAGVVLTLYHPKWDRSCAACVQWAYGTDGRVMRDADGKPVPRTGPTPCMSCPKVPPSVQTSGKTPDQMRAAATEPEPRHRAAIRHYEACRATNDFPRDALVKWVAGIVHSETEAYQRWREQQRADQTTAVLTLITELAVRR